MRLLSKLILITLGGIIITTAVAGYFTFIFTKSALQKTIKDQQEELGRQTMDKISRLLYERYIDIQSIAEEEDLEEYLTKGGDRKSPERRMNELRFLSGPWDILFAVDKNGTIVLSTKKEESGTQKKVQAEPFSLIAFNAALAGKPYYSDIIVSDDTGRRTIIFAAPVRNEDSPKKPIVGVVVANLSWPAINEIVFTIPAPLATHLHDKNGVLIAANEPIAQNMLFQESFRDNPAIARALKGEKGFIIGPGMTHKSGSGQAMKTDDASPESLISFLQEDGYLGFRGNGWILSIETPTDIAFAPATDTAWNIVLLMFPIILFSAALTMAFLNRFIVRPVTDFTEVTNVIAEGDLTKRAEIKSKDEIGKLAKSFNTMADRVQDSFNILRTDKDRIETLMESIGDGVMAIEPDGKIILWNKAAHDISGWPKEEALGKNFHDILKLVRENDKKDNSGFIDTAMKTKTAQTMANHTALVRKDGKEIPVGDSAAPILDANGVLQGIIVVFRDVTEERIIDKAKEEFVSIASHQLRTPLTAIKGYAGMLLDQDAGPLNEKQNEYLREIKIGNDRMIGLVTALLNVSRIDLGVFAIEPQQVNFEEIAKEIFKELAEEISVKNLHIETDYDKNLPEINADAKLIRIILYNLLANAVKYTPSKGFVSFRIQKQNHHLTITVADSGYGIPKDAQSKIFTKLFRADNARQKDPNGNGLGLYIVKAIVEASDGKIWFESEENKGTTFYISFPLGGMKKREGTRMLQ